MYHTINLTVGGCVDFQKMIGQSLEDIQLVEPGEYQTSLLVHDGIIVGFSCPEMPYENLDNIHEYCREKHEESKRRLKSYRKQNSDEISGDWGTWGLYHDAEYFHHLSDQMKYLQEHETAVEFWKKTRKFCSFTKMDFKGKGGYYS